MTSSHTGFGNNKKKIPHIRGCTRPQRRDFYKLMLKEISPREKDILLRFGMHLKALRNAKGLTQEKLNFKADLSKNAVGLIERGEINCSLLTLEALARGLDISLKKLIDFE